MAACASQAIAYLMQTAAKALVVDAPVHVFFLTLRRCTFEPTAALPFKPLTTQMNVL